MAEKRWVHISFSWPGETNTERFEAVFSKAKYWMRYSRNCWMIYTGVDLDTWRDRVRNIPGMEKQNIFLLEFDAEDVSGYLSEWIWEKLHEYENDE